MSTAIQRRQAFIRHVRKVKGTSEATMQEVAEMARQMGWPLPKPIDPMEIFAKQFADAAREETRHDKVTNKVYKANLAYARKNSDGKQLWFWFDVDEASRAQMLKGLHHYREQMVSEAIVGVNTAEHWNRMNPRQMELQFVTNLSQDVAERRAADEVVEIAKIS
ncbi:hypothetical protein FTO74_09030 [Granulicella sp. WH15]|uniref:hypothetical protein n=1 Tax=Granulicella sp. WH15 TaxID=2602070 RepID=UPI001366E26A|nr:hypothetical protein [Granulicella sp. WH15]QHN03494.1 hypothetical protein FTO74_09030 [Granulicella sp. WH15]